jgi:hypothetical protein
MYQASLQHNYGTFKLIPVKFATPQLALRHAEKLADQFLGITDYHVKNTLTNQVVEFKDGPA